MFCLKDKPTSPLEYQQKLESYIADEPGQSYDRDAQCEMVYGTGARICPYMVRPRKVYSNITYCDGDSGMA